MAQAVAAVVLGSACQRAPQEDFVRSGFAAGYPVAAAEDAAPLRQPAAAPLAALPSGRCLKLTPNVAPPPVAVGPAANCPPDPETTHGKLPEVHVTFPDAGGQVDVEAELVRTEHDTARGLMFRRHLSEDRGMLFDLRVRDDHKFWMHNTCIPLDLLFIDDDGLLVGIVENAPTLDDTSRGVGCPSRWVLEVNAGWSRRHGIKAGQHVNLP